MRKMQGKGSHEGTARGPASVKAKASTAPAGWQGDAAVDVEANDRQIQPPHHPMGYGLLISLSPSLLLVSLWTMPASLEHPSI